MEDITLKFENPIGKKRRKKKSTSSKKTTSTKKRTSTKRRKSRPKTSSVIRTRRGLGNTTVGKRRRRKSPTIKRARRSTTRGAKVGTPTRRTATNTTTMGRKNSRTRRGSSRTFGINLDIRNMFTDLLSFATMGVGAFGGLIGTNYVAEFIFGKKAPTGGDVNVDYQGSILSGLITYGALHLIDNWVRPTGAMANAFTGAKFGAIFSSLIKLKSVLFDEKNMDEISYVISTNTPIFGQDPSKGAGESRLNQSLMRGGSLGSSYYISDTGEAFPLGQTKIGYPTMGQTKIGYPTMGYTSDSSERIQDSIDQLLSGPKTNAINNNSAINTTWR